MAGQISDSQLGSDGIILCRSILAPDGVANWKAAIDSRYHVLEIAHRNGDVAKVKSIVETAERFVPTASSFTIGALSLESPFIELLRSISTGVAGMWIKNILSNRLLCNQDQSWVRRQYAPSRYPPLHAPHGWHQDGALKFDFQSHPNGDFPPNAVLNMVTCWISLDSCGLEAPGLQLITERPGDLLPPHELQTDRLQARFGAEHFWQPTLGPGDALLFLGDILHRTHVVPEMSKDRTSIELRFFSAVSIPERLQSDRFIPCG
jgi:hypothetical protein